MRYSWSTSCPNPAITKENAVTLRGIVYCPYGGILIENFAELTNATGKFIRARNEVKLIYTSDIANMLFQNSGGYEWQIYNWQEDY